MQRSNAEYAVKCILDEWASSFAWIINLRQFIYTDTTTKDTNIIFQTILCETSKVFQMSSRR